MPRLPWGPMEACRHTQLTRLERYSGVPAGRAWPGGNNPGRPHPHRLKQQQCVAPIAPPKKSTGGILVMTASTPTRAAVFPAVTTGIPPPGTDHHHAAFQQQAWSTRKIRNFHRPLGTAPHGASAGPSAAIRQTVHRCARNLRLFMGYIPARRNLSGLEKRPDRLDNHTWGQQSLATGNIMRRAFSSSCSIDCKRSCPRSVAPSTFSGKASSGL